MKVANRFIAFHVLFSLMIAVVIPITQVHAAQPIDTSTAGVIQNELVSPEKFLNSDGTLNLDGSTSGSLDLSGWDVQIDSQRGPVFSVPKGEKPSPLLDETIGDWADMGDGGGSPVPDYIFAVAVSGSNVYVGGWFKDLDNIPEADNVAKWDSVSGSWSALGSNGAGESSVSSTVWSLTASGSDVYVGGSFSNVNNNGTPLPAADYIAKWNGTDWSALGSSTLTGGGSLTSAVYAIAVSGSDVYAGGQFTDIRNGAAVLTAGDYIAKWDSVSGNWSALGSNGAGGGSINNNVTALAVSGTDVYVGGYFTNVNNNGTSLPYADYIARWNGTNWFELGNAGINNSGSLNGAVNDIAISGTDVYVGGNFTNVDNYGTTLTAADFIAKWSTVTTSWSALGSNGAGNGSLGQHVNAVAVIGTNVYVGGQFDNVNSGGFTWQAADYIAKWDGSNWAPLGSNGLGNGSLNNAVLGLAASGSDLYVIGHFDSVSNNGTIFSHAVFAAKWSGSNWSALGNMQGSIVQPVLAMAASGTDVYVGGNFRNVSNDGTAVLQADNLAKWDGSNWSALGGNFAGEGVISGTVYAIAVSGTDVYVGGQFFNIDFLDAGDNIAKWDGTDWSALGSNGAGDGSLNSPVYSIAVSGSNVYVGGQFTDVNNNGVPLPAADYIAKWDGTDWSALGSNGAGDGSLNSAVKAIAVSGSNVYAGGWFSNVSNNGTPLPTADFIAKWNGTDWSALGSNGAGDGSLGSGVFAVAVSGSDVYAGGQFVDVNNNGTPLPVADFIAKWNGTDWSALGSNGAGDGSLNNHVLTIAVNGSSVYAGGLFYNVNDNGTMNPEADYVAKWDGVHWSSLGSDGAGDGSVGGPTFPQVNALAVSGAAVYVGGDFFNVNNNGTPLPYADYVASFTLTDINAEVDVSIGSVPQESYVLGENESVKDTYAGILNGPVRVVSTNGIPMFTSQVVTSGGSYNELMGYPNNQLHTEYWFPWYDHGYSSVPGSTMRTWLAIGNPHATLTADVDVYIGGIFKANYDIAPGGQVTPRWIGLQDGPVRIVSTNGVDIFASQRVFTVPDNSFNESMGYPSDQFVTEYWFPWYDSTNMNSALMIGNTSSSTPANVDVYIGGVFKGSYVIGFNDTLIQSYAGLVNGPVRVVGTNGVNIVVSQRVRSGPKNSYNEVMGYPNNQFHTEYWFPWYDHGYSSVSGSNMRTWLAIGNPHATLTADVDVYIDGVFMANYDIVAGGQATPRWIGLQDGPVQIISLNGVDIFASQRVFTVPNSVFNEMLGFPADQLTSEYWFPWYDSVNMGTSLFLSTP